MALTFTEATEQGFDAWEAVGTGTMITDFTYLMQEKPDIYKDLIYTFRDPLIAQFLIEGNVKKGATSSDQNRWYEAGRIQDSFHGNVTLSWAGAVGTLTMPSALHDIKPTQTLVIGDNALNTIQEVYVRAVSGVAVTVASKEAAGAVVLAGAAITVIHLASDAKQGDDVDPTGVTHKGVWRSNNPIIVTDYEAYDRSKLKQIINFSDDMTRYTIDNRAMQIRFDNAQILAGVFGIKSEAASEALTVDIVHGSESVIASVKDRGNTVAGTFATKADLNNYIKTLNSVKGSKTNQLLVDLDTSIAIDDLLGSLDKHEGSSYNFGQFSADVDFRKLGFSGFTMAGGYDTMYKHWDVLDDTTYWGAFNGNTAKPKGLSIPKGEVQLASGGSMPYLSFLYRDGMDKQVSRSGAVAGIGHKDNLSISFVTELTPRTVSAKDFIAFN